MVLAQARTLKSRADLIISPGRRLHVPKEVIAQLVSVPEVHPTLAMGPKSSRRGAARKYASKYIEFSSPDTYQQKKENENYLCHESYTLLGGGPSWGVRGAEPPRETLGFWGRTASRPARERGARFRSWAEHVHCLAPKGV